jgi:hypothetical protein
MTMEVEQQIRAAKEHRQLNELRQHVKFLEARSGLLQSLLSEAIRDQYFDLTKTPISFLEELRRTLR